MRSSTPRSNAHKRAALTEYGRNNGMVNCLWIGGFFADKKVDGEICSETRGTPCFSCNNLAPNAQGSAPIMVSLSTSPSQISNKRPLLTPTTYHTFLTHV